MVEIICVNYDSSSLVYKTEDKWKYLWKTSDGTTMCKSYDINELGEEEAEKQARDMQRKKIAFEMLKKFANK